MARTDYRSIDDYLAAQPPATRRLLARVRAIIAKAVPDAAEVISYQIPAFRLKAGVVIFFAGWKQHYSVYPATAGVVAALGPALAKYEVSKGTIRFPLDAPVPERLIARVAKVRAAEVKARTKGRTSGTATRAKRTRSDG